MKSAILVFLLAACTQFLPDDDTCLTYLEVVPRDPGRVQYTVPVVDFDTQLTTPTAVPDAVLQVCTNATCLPEFPRCDGDVGQCWREFPGPVPAIRVLDFPYGLANVTLRVSAAGYVPTDYPMGGPIIGSPDGALSVQGAGIVLVKTETFAALHAQVGAVPLADRGTLAIRVLDCAYQRADGAEVTPWNANLNGATTFSLSSNNLASGGLLRTDQRGVAGFLNLPTQTIDVEISGWSIPPATFNIRPGVLTLAELRWGLDQFGR